MRKLFLKTFGFFVCIVWSGISGAVGFGGINVTSSLGQPLAAEIELVAVSPADKSSLNVHLASPEAFKAAGIDFPATLPKLKFHVETRANGEVFISAASDQAVNEPYVSLLLELSWSSGRLMREYTFLLDPVGFVAEQPAAPNVNPIEPSIAKGVAAEVNPQSAAVVTETIAESSPRVAESITAEAASAVPAEAAKTVDSAVVETPAKKRIEVNHAAASPITVKQGDNLTKIASNVKAPDVSMERMLVALYRVNAEEFDGHNMNRIRTGKILRLPESEELAKIQQVEAVDEIHAHVDNWNIYRQKLAAASTKAVERKSKQEVAGKISTSIADKAPAAKESAKEVLKLSKGEAPGDHAIAGGKEKSTAKEEDAIAKAKALKESEQRTALLEKNIKDMKRLVELKSKAALVPASAVPLVVSAVVPASATAAASAVAEIKPEEPAESTLLDNPVALGGAAAAGLGLVWLGFTLFGKGKKKDKKSSEVPAATSDTSVIEEAVQATPDKSNFTHARITSEASSEEEEVDPIREADLFLNFGRDQQAEEVLKKALLKDPSNNAIKLKLLSIYSNRKDTLAFYDKAVEIKDSGDEPSWDQAAAMGRELEPENAFYSVGHDAAQVIAAAENISAKLPVLDYDAPVIPEVEFDLGEPDELEDDKPTQKIELPAVNDFAMDFDIDGMGLENKSAAKDAQPELSAAAFDVPEFKEDTVAKPDEQSAALDLDDLVFDEAPALQSDAKADDDGDKVLEFSLDIPSELKSAATAAPAFPKDLGLNGISLNLDDVAEPVIPPQSDIHDDHWQEVATKLDLAKAYQEMGDQAGAREILEEVVRDGDATQRETAETLLQQMA